MDLNTLNEENVLKYIADRIKSARVKLNVTQLELASKTGLSKRTISNMESGKNISLSAFISVLRVLGEINQLEHFLPKSDISPIELSERKGQQRERASKKKIPKQTTWQWGEDK